MPLSSMTGYGRGEASGEQYRLTVEVKSVNHRFRDVRLKMPSLFMRDEIDLKKLIEKYFKRGSFDVLINYAKTASDSHAIDLDWEKIKKFVEDCKGVANVNGVNLQLRPEDFLRNEFTPNDDDEKYLQLKELLFPAFESALKSLEQMRVEEGKKGAEVLLEHLSQYKNEYEVVKKNADLYEKDVTEKLQKRFDEFEKKLEIDKPRFLQEVVFYLEKLDVQEEISRIEMHLSQLEELLKSDGEIGRKIDFLIQELGRETNTIGSKSSNQDISTAVVQMKVQLEKIREQGYNFE